MVGNKERESIQNKGIISEFREFRDSLDHAVSANLLEDFPDHAKGPKYECLEVGEQLAILYPERALQIRADLVRQFATRINDGTADADIAAGIEKGWDWADDHPQHGFA